MQASVRASGTGGVAPSSNSSQASRSRGASHATRDPHTTLHMQPTREELENAARESIVTPYAGKNRPQHRRFEDVLGDSPDGQNFDPSQLVSPAKAGQGRNYQPMRIFDGQEDQELDDSPKPRPNSQFIRPDPRKYNHFDFVDGSDPNDAPKPGVSVDNRPKSKHDSQWSFDDFQTPVKHKPSKAIRHQDVRHWGIDSESPANQKQTPAQFTAKGRRDAEAHFELQDDGEQVPRQERPRPKGAVQNEAMGLYKNQLFDQDNADAPSDRTLGNITNLAHRGKDFDAHWEMRDESPMQNKENTRLSGAQETGRIHIAGDGMGGRAGTNRDWLYGDDSENLPTKKPTGRGKDFESHWELRDEDSPKPTKTANAGNTGRIHIAGDGMGGRAGTNRDWLYGGEGEDEQNSFQAAPKSKGRNKDFESSWGLGDEDPPKATTTKQAQAQNAGGEASQGQGRIHIAGDGMGGRAGTNRDWLYGGGEEETPRPAPKRGQLATQSSLWDQGL